MSGVIGGLIGSFPTPVTSSFESIATVTAGSNVTTLTLSSIPSTYKSLQIRYSFTTDFNGDILKLNINSDTGNNYATHSLVGNGSTTAVSGSATFGRIYVGNLGGNTDSTYSSVGIIDIIDYASTSKYKTVRSFEGVNINNSGGEVGLTSGLWQSTSAITSLVFGLTGDNFKTGATFALYGVK